MQHMPSVGSGFTPLEQAVLRAICEMQPVDQAALEGQLSTAMILRRENTGAGFYTRFSIKHCSDTATGGERLRRGPVAKIDGLEHGMGFILWLNRGYADYIEGYCYEESTIKITLEQAGFEILQG
jgi:hypothetical protein